MHIKLEINAESVEEFDAAVARFAPGRVAHAAPPAAEPARESTAAEAETPAFKKRAGKSQTAADTAAETGSLTKTEPAEAETAAPSEEPASSEPDEHPLLVAKTLADVKALGNKLVSDLGANRVQALLLDQFKVKAFGALDPADFDAAYAALEALK